MSLLLLMDERQINRRVSRSRSERIARLIELSLGQSPRIASYLPLVGVILRRRNYEGKEPVNAVELAEFSERCYG